MFTNVCNEFFFPTCQVRVVRFYQSWYFFLFFFLLLLLLPLLHLCPRFHFHFNLRLADSSPASKLSGHCWTSTVSTRSERAPLDLNRQHPISVGTAGLQPPASDLSGHRQSMCQKECQNIWQIDGMPDRMPEGMPQRIPDRMPQDIPDRMPDKIREDMPDRMPEDMPDKMSDCQKICQIECQKICQIECQKDMPDRMSERYAR